MGVVREGAIVAMMLSRRTLVKAGAGSAVGLAFLKFVGPNVARSLADSAVGDEALEWRANVCGICPNFCGIKVGVETKGGQERAVKIEGDPDNTYNRGSTCARGQAGLRLLYSPDRLKQPLIRVEGSKRGDWDFRVATWEEAYSYIFSALEDNDVKPHEMTIVGGWQACSIYSSYILPFCMAAGTPNMPMSTVQRCMYGQALGIDSVTGCWNAHGEITPDTEHAKFLLNFRVNCSVSSSAGRIVPYSNGLRNGLVTATVDPRLSDTARSSDMWLPAKPGTDDALMFTIMNQLFADETYDADFLTLHTNAPFLAYEEGGMLTLAQTSDPETGAPTEYFVYDENLKTVVAVPGVSNRNDKGVDGTKVYPALEAEAVWNGKKVRTVLSVLRERVAECTPEWAAEICDVDVDKVTWTAEQFSRTRPALVYGGWHGARYDTSSMSWKLAGMLMAMVGGIDKPGGWVYTGGGRSGVKGWWDKKNKGEAPGVFGIKKVVHLIHNVFDKPDNWNEGFPALHTAMNEQRMEQGEAGIPFRLFSDMGLFESVAGELSYKGKPYQTKAIFMSAVNPVRSFYNESDWTTALTSDNVKLVIDIDIFPTDSSAYADVILPDLSYLERYDHVFGAESIELTKSARNPVTPVVDGKHQLDILFDLAEGMGIYEKYVMKLAGSKGADPDVWLQKLNEYRADGRSVAEFFQAATIEKTAKSMGVPTEELTEAYKVGAVNIKGRDALMKSAGIPYTYPTLTTSGRIELYSTLFADFNKEAGGYNPKMDPLGLYVPVEFREGSDQTSALPSDEFFAVYRPLHWRLDESQPCRGTRTVRRRFHRDRDRRFRHQSERERLRDGVDTAGHPVLPVELRTCEYGPDDRSRCWNGVEQVGAPTVGSGG